jgi:hypothetical protein
MEAKIFHQTIIKSMEAEILHKATIKSMGIKKKKKKKRVTIKSMGTEIPI